MPVDRDDEFTYRVGRDDTVFVSWRGRRVTTLTGAAARRFLDGVRDADPPTAQRWMARVTGNFKRGNERGPHRR
jgi:hypothetical protein